MNGFFNSAGSGIPGVGVAPFGTALMFAGSGMPGVEFPDGGTGLVERPGGRLFASTFTAPVPTLALTLLFVSDEPHAEKNKEKETKAIAIRTFDINSINLFKFKIAVPA